MSMTTKCTCGASFSSCNGDERCRNKMPNYETKQEVNLPLLDLRTYIATKAMQGYCAHYEYSQMSYDKLANAAVLQA